MDLRQNRVISLILILATYVAASIIGVLTYNALNYEIWLNLLIADSVATVAVFAVSVAVKNASVYDPYWSVQPIIIILCFSFDYGVNLMSIIVVGFICLWGLRLTVNLLFF